MRKLSILLALLLCAHSYAAPVSTDNKSATPAKQTIARAISQPVTTNKPATIIAASPSQPTARPVTKPAEEKHLWNLQDVDIMKVIAQVSRETGKNFVVSPQVNGHVTIVSSTPLTANEVYPVFLSALQTLGYSAVPSGKLIKILPVRDGNQLAHHVTSGKTGSGDNMVVRVMRLSYVSATQLVPILNPLIPTWANVSAYAPANSVIVSGTADVVSRIAGIVNRVDTPSANGIDVLHLQYATAEDVAKEIEKIEQANRSTSGDTGAAVSSDDRSNSILISGNAGTRLRMKVMVSQLDTPTTESGSDTQVVYLHYNTVESIIPVLRSVANQSSSSSPTTSTNSSSSGDNSATIGGGSSSSDSSSGSYGSGSSGSGFGSNTQLEKQTNNSDINSGGSSKGGIVIAGDIPSNAIVLTAPPNIMRTLKQVIYQLDVRPKQILVQGIIAEVDANKLKNFGIEWGTSTALPSGIGGTATPFTLNGGMGAGVLKAGSFDAVISALQTDSTANILSTPSVMVMNNTAADIKVGKTIPETGGQYQPGSDTQNDNPYVTYQDKPVGLVLSVVPQITDDDSVRMKIVQTNSSVISNNASSGSESAQANPNPTTSDEEIKTTVLVKNAQVLVLGGLTNSQEEDDVTSIPILGSIPLLGQLFKHTDTTVVKKDLLVFLRPIIINGPGQAKKVSDAKYSWMRDYAKMSLSNKNKLVGSSVPTSLKPQPLPVPFSNSGD